MTVPQIKISGRRDRSQSIISARMLVRFFVEKWPFGVFVPTLWETADVESKPV